MQEIISLINARYLCGGDSIKELRAVSWKHIFMLDALPNKNILDLFNRIKQYSRLVYNSEQMVLNEDFLLVVHSILNGNVKSTFRKHQNLVGSHYAQNAIFVPPPPDKLKVLLDTYFFTALQSNSSLSIEDIIQIYSNFLKIHPFSDGNGRVARVIFDYLLRKSRPDIVVSPLMFRLHRNDLYRNYVKTVGGDYAYSQYVSLPFWEEAIKYSEIGSAKCNAVLAEYIDRSASNVIALSSAEYSLLNETRIFPVVKVCKNKFDKRIALRSESLSLYYEDSEFIFLLNKQKFKLWLDLEKLVLFN